VNGRHRAAKDLSGAGLLRTWYDGLPLPSGRRSATTLCPRCGSERIAGYGSQAGCGHCGATWQADALLVEPRRPPEPPPDPGRRAAARQRVDEAAHR
jgi:ribosomal protein S27AE